MWKSFVQIPYDVYTSPQEIVIVMPLWWVKKDSLSISIKKYTLYIKGERIAPKLKESLVPLEENCYRWTISTHIDLPPTVYFADIHVVLSPENVLTVVIPKVIDKEKIYVDIQ